MKHAKAIISIIVIIAMATGMTGCHTNHGVVNLTEEITPSGTDTESSGETAVSQNEFAYKLFKECYREGENTLISPMSVFFALAVTANGARGETLDEILDLISDKASTEELNELCRAYKNLLSAEELKTADSVWMRDDNYLTINQDFLQTVKEFYSADVFKSSFDSKTVDDVNNWVNEKTDGMIKEIIDEIDEDHMFYIINALSFDAKWLEPFEKKDVRDEVFTSIDGSVSKQKLMYGSESEYISDGKARGFIKEYSGGKYSFAALLPNSDISISEYIQSMSSEIFNENNIYDSRVNIAIPKFDIEYSKDLKDTLAALGIKTAFSALNADFSGMGRLNTGDNIYVSKVLHKTHITVDESGTKAGAVTSVSYKQDGAGSDNIRKIILNRPFIYMIIDNENNLPIFIGAVDSLK